MPELPEVETITRSLSETIVGATLSGLVFHRKDLREELPKKTLTEVLSGEEILSVFRRSKYILIETNKGFALIHLGMTGNVFFETFREPKRPHTHVVFEFLDKGGARFFIHYVDPRRFGRMGAQLGKTWQSHPYLTGLGVEPLEEKQLGAYLYQLSRNRNLPVKNFIMDSRIVVGVGNIYACEALFKAHIRPTKKSGSISRQKYDLLSEAIKKTLRAAIKAGGTTIRDFRSSEGNPGYFSQSLNVYGRKDKPCLKCGAIIRMTRMSGRSSFFCAVCQK